VARKEDGFEEGRRVGVSAIGVSTMAELEESLAVWKDVVDEFERGRRAGGEEAGDPGFDAVVGGIQKRIGTYMDFSWESPSAGFEYREPSGED
jgi:hypothetical protein